MPTLEVVRSILDPGDTIAVDYRFAVSPNLSFVTLGWRADVDVDYGWIRGYAGYDSSNEQQVSGFAGPFLDDQRIALVGVELRHDGQSLAVYFLFLRSESFPVTSSRGHVRPACGWRGRHRRPGLRLRARVGPLFGDSGTTLEG